MLRERAGRLPRLQEELRRCRERLQAVEACKGQLEVSGQAGLWEVGLGEGRGLEAGLQGMGWSLRSEKGESGLMQGAVMARRNGCDSVRGKALWRMGQMEGKGGGCR